MSQDEAPKPSHVKLEAIGAELLAEHVRDSMRAKVTKLRRQAAQAFDAFADEPNED